MNKNRESGAERRVTQSDIAKALGVSIMTVSMALRNKSTVSKQTRERVQQKAEELSYRPDPQLSALNRYRTNSGGQPVHSALAWINTWDPPERLRQQKEFDLYWQGASDNAKRMGYHLETFNLTDLPVRRLKTIFRARNIQGILLPPLGNPTTLLHTFSWNDFAVVRFGQAIPEPEAHFVNSSQLENAMLAFDNMRRLGYQRIGCVCQYSRMRFFGSGFIWAQRELPPNQQIPLLTKNPAHTFEQKQKQLAEWIQQNQPDAILTDGTAGLHMLNNLGYRIPEDIALATTSVHDTEIDAGIDQQPYEIGWAATRMLTSLIDEQAYGLPNYRTELLIKGSWVDGSMLPDRTLPATL
ncbi:LacI family DNA-binding transcriptional regulator [Pontiellaceae bacterium B1224]|nr:LacI family DNA-binding transcriptional regulator [Pontiellaceae bacterium B1224]